MASRATGDAPTGWRLGTHLLAMLLLSLPFIGGGIIDALSEGATVGGLPLEHGPAPPWLTFAGVVMQLTGAALLLLGGYRRWWGAALLAAFLLLAVPQTGAWWRRDLRDEAFAVMAFLMQAGLIGALILAAHAAAPFADDASGPDRPEADD